MSSVNEHPVLFFVDRIFWPADDGHKVVLSNYCKALASEYGCQVHVLSFLEPGQSPTNIAKAPAYITSVELVKKPLKSRIIINLISALLRGAKGGPLQCALFNNEKAAAQLRDAVRRIHPTHVFIDLPRLSPFVTYIQDCPCKKVLYMEDLFSKRYSRQLKGLSTLKKAGGVAGKYSAGLSGGIARLASARTLQHMVLSIESRRMRILELGAPKKFDYVVLVSPVEAESLAYDTNAGNVFAIPIGVDCSYYMAGPHPKPRPGILSFLGDMRTAANADSLRFIANEVLPLIEGSVVLEVSGIAPDELRNEFAGNKQVRFLGRVEDTREVLRSSSAFLAPIAYGTGIKTKILEAMAIGVPIVTNSVGNEGIGLIDGVEAFVRDDPQGLADGVGLLLADRYCRKEVAERAQQKVVNQFDRSHSLADFSRIGLGEAKNG